VKSLAFSVVFFFVSLAVLCLSLLYMLAPRTYRRFVALYSRADTWSSINPIPPKERFISERVAGFFMTLMALMMVRVAVSGLLKGGVVLYNSPKSPETPPNPLAGVIGGIVMVGIRVFFLLRPEPLLQATRRNFPDRVLSPRFVRNAPRGGRIFGILTILYGAYLLHLAYAWAH